MTETMLAAFKSGTEARTGSDAHPSWRALTWFSLFRLFLAFGLLIVFVQHPAKQWQLHGPFSLTVWVPPIYTFLVLLGTLSQLLRWPAKEKQAQIAVFIDIVAVTLLMHGTGGAGTSGALGLLLAISVAAGSLLMAGRLSLLFAAFATLGVISQQIYTQIYLDPNTVKLTQAGLLGITFFTVALLGHVLYQRIRETEKLAARRQVDIDDLSILNEFIIQNMRTGVLVVDRYRRVRLMNSAAIAFLGLPQSPEGVHLRNFAPALADWLSAQRRHIAAGEESRSIVVGEYDLKPTCHPFGDGAGSLIFLRDNRELVKEAQEIKLASLGRLTASIAHNIRNPLSAVSHAGQLLAESATLSAQDRHLLDIVRRNSSRIDDTIESVLQLSRSGQPTPERIELCSWLEAFCKELRETRGLSRDRLRLKCPQDSLSVDVDPRHLHQIISNLCDNSLKHAATAQQPVRIAIRVQANAIRGYPMIEVADNGPGIPRDTAREIFEPFFSTSPSGTGLGLYIAKELSKTNGAELQYIGSMSPGTRFRLNFPPDLAMSKAHVLIVDDEADILELLQITLSRMAIGSDSAADVATAKRLLASKQFDLCLTDMRLPDGSGIDLVKHIARTQPDLPVAVITAHGNMETAVSAMKAGAFDFVSKPVDLAILRRLVESALRLSGPAEQTDRSAASAARSDLLGKSPQIRELRRLIAKLARSQAPVFISGESGTGKELAARLIHSQGPRAEGAFVPVNCGAIPRELVESELFGHKKGSFTGAVSDKQGLFHAAEGGTLFLDEIADLPLDVQAKLLRAIQEKSVRPVGANQESPVDARIISASHRDLNAQVEKRSFRQDLFYRINVIELRIPPLRERPEDILVLAEQILDRIARQSGEPKPSLTPAARAALDHYGFPGNVRELENVLERAMTLKEGGNIDASDLRLPQVAINGDPLVETKTEQPLEDYLDEVERQAIVKALEATHWNRTAAARRLGMTLRSLRYRLSKLDIE